MGMRRSTSFYLVRTNYILYIFQCFISDTPLKEIHFIEGQDRFQEEDLDITKGFTLVFDFAIAMILDL